jgi:hypothetical protein
VEEACAPQPPRDAACRDQFSPASAVLPSPAQAPSRCDKPSHCEHRPEPCTYDVKRHGRHHATQHRSSSDAIGQRNSLESSRHTPSRGSQKATKEELVIIVTRVIVSGRLIDLMI